MYEVADSGGSPRLPLDGTPTGAVVRTRHDVLGASPAADGADRAARPARGGTGPRNRDRTRRRRGLEPAERACVMSWVDRCWTSVTGVVCAVGLFEALRSLGFLAAIGIFVSAAVLGLMTVL